MKGPRMNIYVLGGAAMAFISYIPLTIAVWRKTLKQNFATYALWGLLDTIAAGSIMLKGGNFLLPAMYVACCFGILIGILRTRTFSWGKLETLISVLVVISIGVWMLVGDREATIVSSVGVGLAGLPQLVDFWKKPVGAPLLEYIGFSIANGLSLYGGADWSISERFYSSVCLALTLSFVLVIVFRQRFSSHRLA